MSNNIQEKVSASCMSSPRKAFLDGVALAPVTTTTGQHPAFSATDAARLSNDCPRNSSVCFGFPIRVDGPAASTTAAMAAESVSLDNPGMLNLSFLSLRLVEVPATAPQRPEPR
jgi:hypothetical protein